MFDRCITCHGNSAPFTAGALTQPYIFVSHSYLTNPFIPRHPLYPLHLNIPTHPKLSEPTCLSQQEISSKSSTLRYIFQPSQQRKDILTITPPQSAPPVTPRKRQRKPKKEGGEENRSDDDDETHSPTKKANKETPSKRSRGLGPLPASYDEAGEADRLLLKMKDEEAKPWAVINEALEGIAGCKLTGLSTRYARIKANFTVFPKEDVRFVLDYLVNSYYFLLTCGLKQETHLLQSKKDIEAKFEVEKWQRIASDIEAKSGNKYSASVVQKKFKELSKTATGSALGE